jgi:outer membrane protein TolC
MNQLKTILLSVLILTGVQTLRSQQAISLEDVLRAAHMHHPVNGRDSLIDRAKALEIKNLNHNYLPALSLEAKATWQSEVTTINLPIPGLDFPEFPQDQYKISLDLRQLIWDGGLTQSAKEIEQRKAELSKEQWKTAFTSIDHQLNSVFHGILLMNENERSLYAALQRLSNQKNWLMILQNNGMANSSQVSELAIEELKIQQAIHELHFNRQEALISMELLSGQTYDAKSFLLDIQEITPSGDPITRAEFRVLENQLSLFDLQMQVQEQQRMPKIAAFSQLGYGKPGLNMFSTEFNEYALVGIHLNWTIYDWGQSKNNRQKLSLEKEKTGQDKALLEQSIRLKINSYQQQSKRLKTQYEQQAEVIALRKEILQAKEKQMKEGTLLLKDYLDQLNQLMMDEVKLNELKIKSIQVIKAEQIERGILRN